VRFLILKKEYPNAGDYLHDESNKSWTMASLRRRRCCLLILAVDGSDDNPISTSICGLFLDLMFALAIHVVFVLFGSGEGKK
jgi:hypothetical protein